jgi:hypothetical protein
VRLSNRHRHDPAYGITTAEGSHLDDISKRQRQYGLTMLFRLVAVLTVVFVPGLSVLERAILGLVATIIPYVAVIRANGGPTNSADPTNLMVGGPRQGQLPAGERSLGAGRRVDGEAGEEYDGYGPYDGDGYDGDGYDGDGGALGTSDGRADHDARDAGEGGPAGRGRGGRGRGRGESPRGGRKAA